ncbi:MAG: hypothetical protein ACRCXD_17040 [Luteolibacter sp.]
MHQPTTPSADRGMPRWREKQRSLPIQEKVALIGQLILETRQLESLKKACKPSVTSSKDF